MLFLTMDTERTESRKRGRDDLSRSDEGDRKRARTSPPRRRSRSRSRSPRRTSRSRSPKPRGRSPRRERSPRRRSPSSSSSRSSSSSSSRSRDKRRKGEKERTKDEEKRKLEQVVASVGGRTGGTSSRCELSSLSPLPCPQPSVRIDPSPLDFLFNISLQLLCLRVTLPSRFSESLGSSYQVPIGVYIPPHKMRLIEKQVKDKASEQYQRLTWDALKKSLNGLINKVTLAIEPSLLRSF